jgi:hypothetical protein
MQTEEMTWKQVSMANARAVRRRLADMKMADELRERGFSVEPPRDEIQEKVEAR